MFNELKFPNIERCLNDDKEIVEGFIETYQGSELEKKLSKQENGDKKRALFTDIDDTFFRKDRKDAMEKLVFSMENKK